MQTTSQRGARLISAAGRGDLETVKKYVENDAALLWTQDDDTSLFPGWTSLHWAARNGHVEVAKYLLEKADKKAEFVNTQDQVITLFFDHRNLRQYELS
jgi:ankyrin repeat protein